MKHLFYRLVYRLESPLALGSGNDERTDKDVARDSRGIPIIPASSIAGVMRSYAGDKATEIFGYINGSDRKNSSVKVYDAVFQGEFKDKIVSVRDSVRLEDKVAAKTGKFDFEAVETGAEFVGYIELDKFSEKYSEEIEKILSAMNSGILRLGAKTTRGYGKVKLSSVKRCGFDIDDKEQLQKWLDFDMFSEDCWKNVDELDLGGNSNDTVKIVLTLSQQGGLSIRSYSTDLPDANSDSAPDYKYTSLSDGTPVIPGTSWAGAIRSRFFEFAGKKRTENLFGTVGKDDNDNTVVKKSRIVFSESRIKDYTEKVITRTSVDRFSGAVKQGALYTEKSCFYGETELEIQLPRDTDRTDKIYLSAVIADIDGGYLAIGGLTSIGRGLFRVEKMTVDERDCTELLHSRKLTEIFGEGK